MLVSEQIKNGGGEDSARIIVGHQQLDSAKRAHLHPEARRAATLLSKRVDAAIAIPEKRCKCCRALGTLCRVCPTPLELRAGEAEGLRIGSAVWVPVPLSLLDVVYSHTNARCSVFNVRVQFHGGISFSEQERRKFVRSVEIRTALLVQFLLRIQVKLIASPRGVLLLQVLCCM